MEGGRVEKKKCIDRAVPLKENTATYLQSSAQHMLSHNNTGNPVLDANMQGNQKREGKKEMGRGGGRPTKNQTSGTDDKSRKKIRCRQLCLSRNKPKKTKKNRQAHKEAVLSNAREVPGANVCSSASSLCLECADWPLVPFTLTLRSAHRLVQITAHIPSGPACTAVLIREMGERELELVYFVLPVSVY